LSVNQILVVTTQGELFLIEVKIDSQQNYYLDHAKLFYKTDCAIWDLVVLR